MADGLTLSILFVAGAPCFHARNGGHGLPELANHVHLCSPYINPMIDYIAEPQDHSLEGQCEDRD